MKKVVLFSLKYILSLLILVSIIILGLYLFGSFKSNYCSKKEILNLYMKDIEVLNSFLKKNESYPSQYISESPFCIEYTRDDIETEAFLWISIGQTSVLGYKLPDKGYLAQEPDMQNKICQEMKALKNTTMKKHFFQNNDFCEEELPNNNR